MLTRGSSRTSYDSWERAVPLLKGPEIRRQVEAQTEETVRREIIRDLWAARKLAGTARERLIEREKMTTD